MGHPYGNFVFAINSLFTRRQYEVYLKKFFKELYLDRGGIEAQCERFVMRCKEDKEFAEDRIMWFLQKQRRRVDDKQITGGTVKNYVKAIKLFYEMNDILVDWRKLTRGLPRGRRWANDRAPMIEEIRKIATYPDRRIPPVIYTMVSSGIRLGAWSYLRWGHISSNVKAATVRVYAGEEEEYYTFITPEAYNALNEWMEFRKKSGEVITKDSWVMIHLWNVKKPNPKPKQLGWQGVKSMIETAVDQSGVRGVKDKQRYEFPTSHGFRKFFKTKAEQVMKPLNVEMIMGHAVGLSRSYYKPRESELLEDYLKAVPSLTINELNVIKDEKDKQLSDLQEQVKLLMADREMMKKAYEKGHLKEE